MQELENRRKYIWLKACSDTRDDERKSLPTEASDSATRARRKPRSRKL